MFDRFSNSERAVILRAVDIAQSKGREHIEPDHILFALLELHAGLFERLTSDRIDIQSVRRELAQLETPTQASPARANLQFNEQSKRVMQFATREARSCWERWEAPRRESGQMLPEDREYWEARLRQPLKPAKLPPWLTRWMLRWRWEVDERHLLLGLLTATEYTGLAVLTKQGVTLEAARQQLCATEV